MRLKKIITGFLLVVACSHGRAQVVNYVRTWDVQRPITDATTITANSINTDALMSSQYLDGLGRPIQTVTKGITSLGKDMVSPTVYDPYGREQFKYLPYASSGSDGSFKSSVLTEQQSYYNDNNPNSPIKGQGETYYYGQTDYEPSPLNRVQKVFAPGNSWVGSRLGSSEKSIVHQYSTNTTDEGIRIWTIGGTPGSLPVSINSYTTGQLYKNISIDEAQHQVIEYQDAQQRVILKKIQLSPTPGIDHSGWLCTYYVYDDFNNLRFVIQPRAVEIINSSWSISQSIADELCFRYEYDSRNRMIIKKIPGASELWMVYDNRDRLIYAQDGNMRGKNWWHTTLYDNFNRQVQTGMMTYAGSRDVLQNYVNTLISSSTTIDASGTGISNIIDNMVIPQRESGRISYQATASIEFRNGFTSEDGAAFTAEIVSASGNTFTGSQTVNMTPFPPGSSFVPLTMAFFDNYTFTSKSYATTNNIKLNDIGTNSYGDPLPAASSLLIRGIITGTRVRVIENADDLTQGKWMETATFYDNKGRVTQAQADNYQGGTDIVTTRYNFSTRPLASYLVHNNSSGGIINFTIRTLMNYDVAGRLLNIQKSLNDGIAKTIDQNTYDESGQLKTKGLGTDPVNSPNPLETLTYDYNIRGWLLGMNRDFAKTSNSTVNKFGFDLGYDKTAVSPSGGSSIGSYSAAQYNGNIEGTVWKSAGDGQIRKYDFSYDNVNRLTAADFNQYTNSAFNKTANVDFSVSNLSYDANGNILSIKQMGLKLNSSSVVDDLTYNYFLSTGIQTYSNRLQNVVDAGNDPQTSLGDFRYSASYNSVLGGIKISTAADYAYDSDGSLTQDLNKDISSISYNFLSLPFLITVTNKGNVTYIYDATGNKLEKRTVDNTSNPSAQTITTYLGGFEYQNNVLQFFEHEEGRVRKKTDGTFAYDYFLKDHLANVRMVLTDDVQQNTYPAATLEGTYDASSNSMVNYEKQFYNIDNSKITPESVIPSWVSPPETVANTKLYYNNNGNPPANTSYPSNCTPDQTAGSNNLYKLNATQNRSGLEFMIKVMAGDKIDIFGKSYYLNTSAITNSNSTTLDLASLITNFLLAPGNPAGSKGFNSSLLSTINSGSGGIPNDFFRGNNSESSTTVPKAYINYIFFDEQFHYAGGGASRVGASGIVKDHWYQDPQLQNIATPKNGYIFVYVSNESNIDVFFDNLQVIHKPGPILEETHYYPFGLTMAGISTRAAGELQNKDKTFQGQKFDDDLGINYVEFKYRNHDPQIGRFIEIDPLADKYPYNSTYAFSENKVTNNVELEGLEAAAVYLPPGTTSAQYDEFNRGYTESLTKGVIATGLGVGLAVSIIFPGSREFIAPLIAAELFGVPSPNAPSSVVSTVTSETETVATNIATKEVSVTEQTINTASESTTGASAGSKVTSAYARPNNATTPAQRASVQGKPCVTCGADGKMVADHKIPLVKEHYETGTIDKKNMKSIDAVQPQCPTCSAKQGAELKKYSVGQRIANGL